MPTAFRKRGGRKSAISPDGVSTVMSSRSRVDSTLVQALARAFRWRKLFETGVYATIDEMAAAEKINASYVCRVLRLTLLAPDIVEAVLDGRQPAEMTLAALMKPFPVGWGEQGAVGLASARRLRTRVRVRTRAETLGCLARARGKAP